MSLWIHRLFNEYSGLEDEVKEILRKSGWPSLIYLTEGSAKEDVCTILAEIKDKHEEKPLHFTYVFRNIRFLCPTDKLSSFLGGRKKENLDGGLSSETQLWNSLTGRNLAYYPSSSKTLSIKNPTLFYLKHVLARTIIYRENGKDKVKRLELRALSLMKEGQKVEWASYFIEHLKTLSLDGAVEVGGMMTYLLKSLHPNNDFEMSRTVLGHKYRETEFESGKNIRVTSSGEIQWIYFEDKSLVPPMSAKRKGG